MIHSIKRLIGYRLTALDGKIGSLTDFYFDDREWTVRYAVAETSSWPHRRQVLISPRSFGEIAHAEQALHVELSREEVKNSPPIDAHKPISRQYEEEYYRYYGWPYYWQGAALWGMAGFPILLRRSEPFLGEHAHLHRSEKNRRGSLRSFHVVSGYRVQADDNVLGRFRDFLVNDEHWGIQACVVETGSRRAGKRVRISPDQIDRISWDASTIFVNASECISRRTSALESIDQPARDRMTIFI